MGTRHLTMVVLDGVTRVAQYGQWDGYPKEQGNTILDFLSRMDRPLFEQKLRAARFITPEEHDAAWKATGATGEWATQEQAAKFHAQYPAQSRDHGAEILHLVCQSPDGIVLADSSSFAGDSLFCEYAYVIDLDKNVLEMYRGFNKNKDADTGRFKDCGFEPYKAAGGELYYAVELAKTYPLDALPTVEQMCDDVMTEEEREEHRQEVAAEEAAKAGAETKTPDVQPAETK